MFYVILILLVTFLIAFLIFYIHRKKWAIQKVKDTSEEEKLKYVNAALNPFGFTFDVRQDIVISKNDSWQRDMGYTDLYDLKAPFFHIVVDAEPIFFEYDHKKYRLELWKGQYGITTGAEIGLYVQDLNANNKNFYRCATDYERLDIGFILYKKCYLFSRRDFSWWLTGFDVGRFSKPKDLMLKVLVHFPNKEMQIAFVKGLLNAGYSENKISGSDHYVCFEFCSPFHYHLNHKYNFIKCWAQFWNYINCHFFMHFTRYFHSTLDKLTYLRYMAPFLYRFIVRISIPRRKPKNKRKK